MLNWVNRKFAKNPKRYIYLILLILLIIVIIAVEPRKESHGFIDWLQEQFGQEEDAHELDGDIVGDNEETFADRDTAGAAADAANVANEATANTGQVGTLSYNRANNNGKGGLPPSDNPNYDSMDIRTNTRIKLMGKDQQCVLDTDCGTSNGQDFFCLSGELAYNDPKRTVMRGSTTTAQGNVGSLADMLSNLGNVDTSTLTGYPQLTCQTLEWQQGKCQAIADIASNAYIVQDPTTSVRSQSQFCLMQSIVKGHDEPYMCINTLSELRETLCTGLGWRTSELPDQGLPLPRDLFAFHLSTWTNNYVIVPSDRDQSLTYEIGSKIPHPEDKTNDFYTLDSGANKNSAIEVFPVFDETNDYTDQLWNIRNGKGGMFFRLDEDDDDTIKADGCGIKGTSYGDYGDLSLFDKDDEDFQFEIRRYKPVDLSATANQPQTYYTIRSKGNGKLLRTLNGTIVADVNWTVERNPVSESEATPGMACMFYFTPRERKIDPIQLSFWYPLVVDGSQENKLSDLNEKAVYLTGSRNWGHNNKHCDFRGLYDVRGSDCFSSPYHCYDDPKVSLYDETGSPNPGRQLRQDRDRYGSYRMRCNFGSQVARSKFLIRREFDDWFSIRLASPPAFKDAPDHPYCAATNPAMEVAGGNGTGQNSGAFRCGFSRNGDLGLSNDGKNPLHANPNSDKIHHVLFRPVEHGTGTGDYQLQYNWEGVNTGDIKIHDEERDGTNTRDTNDLPLKGGADMKRNYLRDTWHGVTLAPHRRAPAKDDLDGELFKIVGA